MNYPVLKNGADILAIDYEAGVVLAKRGGTGSNNAPEYITWGFSNESGCSDSSSIECYWGHYFNDDYHEARQDYIERVSRGF
jgi:hypothetical protein